MAVTAKNAVWTEGVKYTDYIRGEAEGVGQDGVIEKILSYDEIFTEKQKKKYLKQLCKKKLDELTDLWIEKEYQKIHPHGI
jgi:hypothetical protein